MAEFEAFIAALPRLYPAVHAALELERVNGHALLYRWPGTGPEAGARASVLMAHYDVVPAGDPGEWTQAPFSGHNDGTFLWGRGTLDDKGQLVAILEAAESLLRAGYAPAHDLYFSFGNNEETAGRQRGSRRGPAGRPRREALARPGRGRRGRRRCLPRGEPARRRRRGGRKGDPGRGAADPGPGRARLHAAADGGDGAAGPRHHPDRAQPVPAIAAGGDRGDAAPLRPAHAGAAAGRVRQRGTAPERRSPGSSAGSATRPTR